VCEGNSKLQTLREAAVGGYLQRVVTRIAVEDLLRDVAVAWKRPEVIVVERSVGLWILVLWQELCTEWHRVELTILTQVAPETSDVGNIQHRSPANLSLDSEVGVISGDRLG
jgi:hypothetical protein